MRRPLISWKNIDFVEASIVTIKKQFRAKSRRMRGVCAFTKDEADDWSIFSKQTHDCTLVEMRADNFEV
jgi:hypothetical protein